VRETHLAQRGEQFSAAKAADSNKARMPDVLIDPTVIENLVGGLLVSGPDKVEPDIRVLYPDEPTPYPFDDDADDEPHERWCRINNAVLADTIARRSGTGDPDQQPFVMSITCGVSSAAMRTEPARLNQVAHLVAAALRGAAAAHEPTTHSILIEHAARDTTAAGEHRLNQTAVVAIRGIAQRVSGSTATLNT